MDMAGGHPSMMTPVYIGAGIQKYPATFLPTTTFKERRLSANENDTDHAADI